LQQQLAWHYAKLYSHSNVAAIKWWAY